MSFQDRYRLDLSFGRSVQVDGTALSNLATRIKERLGGAATPEQWRDSDFWLEDSFGPERVSQFFTLGNSINFRYWWFDDSGKYNYCHGPKGGRELRGALYMWKSIKKHCDSKDYSLLDAKYLSKIRLKEVRMIFKDDSGHDVMPALKERCLNWRDLGTKLLNYWKGNFFDLVKETNRSLFLFVQFSRQFRAFDDPLCKLSMVNAIMHLGRGLTNFDERPVPAMDYELLKQLLRNGILRPSGDIEKKVSTGEILSSYEASELRRAGLYAFIRLIDATGVPGDVIDNKYWFNRTACNTDNPVCKVKGKEKDCIFYGVCAEDVRFKTPLEMTRYY